MFDAGGDRAEGDGDVLTLGADANEVYDALTPTSKTLTIAVLTDKKDAPIGHRPGAVPRGRPAEGRRVDRDLELGEFFLHPVEGEWKIFAYRVDRDDQAAEEPSPTGSPS